MSKKTGLEHNFILNVSWKSCASYWGNSDRQNPLAFDSDSGAGPPPGRSPRPTSHSLLLIPFSLVNDRAFSACSSDRDQFMCWSAR